MKIPESLSNEINNRIDANNLRFLSDEKFDTDFFSNDYLGYSGNKIVHENYLKILKKNNINQLGSTGSRLISGNHQLFEILENKAKAMLTAEAALFFNSGFDANIGLLSAVLKPKDVIFYDELCHASIRDGLQMSLCKAYKFKHNDYKDLASKIKNQQKRLQPQNIYIITESVFSMDGDQSDITQLVDISKQFNAYLIIDEAHALGICGKDFKGLSFEYSKDIFARIYTCGKSLGSHGGFVLGSEDLKKYLINFSKPFIYTTGASPHHVAQVISTLDYFENNDQEKKQLQDVISSFKEIVLTHQLEREITLNDTAIQSINIKGNTNAKIIAEKLRNQSIGVKAILSPTVPKTKERIRICLHNFNTEKEIENLIFGCKSYLR
jgi:8-amino-7-oxononanoate synthase